MFTRSICINYKPRLYADILDRILGSCRGVRLVDDCRLVSEDTQEFQEHVDVVILSLGEHGDLDLKDLPLALTDSKIVAFPAHGSIGYRRMPGNQHWEKIVPFGLMRLLDEVLSN